MTVTKTVRLKPEVIPATIRAALAESITMIEKSVRDHTPQGVGGAQSGLRASLFSELQEAPGLFTAVIGSSLPYAEPVESGTKPHFPPPAALIPWVEKFIALKEGETAEGVAFAIARAIARRGTRGARMFEQGLDDARPTVERIFADAGITIETQLVQSVSAPGDSDRTDFFMEGA